MLDRRMQPCLLAVIENRADGGMVDECGNIDNMSLNGGSVCTLNLECLILISSGTLPPARWKVL